MGTFLVVTGKGLEVTNGDAPCGRALGPPPAAPHAFKCNMNHLCTVPLVGLRTV